MTDPTSPDPGPPAPHEVPRPRLGDAAAPAAEAAWRPSYPVYELSVAGVRELDRRAAIELGIPTIVLMENAARNVRDHALDLLARARRCDTLILCGPGNNGGDGLALARHLAVFGMPVRVALAGRPSPDSDAGTQLRIIERMGIPILPHGAAALGDDAPGLVVDALFGTGLTRPVQGIAADLIAWADDQRGRGALVLAVDVPSGLDADSGCPLGETCVSYDRTVTLAAVKTGLTRLEAQPYLGELAVVDIGVPASLLDALGVRWPGLPGEKRGHSGS